MLDERARKQATYYARTNEPVAERPYFDLTQRLHSHVLELPDPGSEEAATLLDEMKPVYYGTLAQFIDTATLRSLTLRYQRGRWGLLRIDTRRDRLIVASVDDIQDWSALMSAFSQTLCRDINITYYQNKDTEFIRYLGGLTQIRGTLDPERYSNLVGMVKAGAPTFTSMEHAARQAEPEQESLQAWRRRLSLLYGATRVSMLQALVGIDLLQHSPAAYEPDKKLADLIAPKGTEPGFGQPALKEPIRIGDIPANEIIIGCPLGLIAGRTRALHDWVESVAASLDPVSS